MDDQANKIFTDAMKLGIFGEDTENLEGINTALNQGTVLNDPNTCPVVDLDGNPLKRNGIYEFRGKKVRVTDWRFGGDNIMDTYYWVWFINDALEDDRITIDAKFPNGTFGVRLYQAPFSRTSPKTTDNWDLQEKLKKLEITAPADWNEYDAYLLDGGTLEYEDWKRSKSTQR